MANKIKYGLSNCYYSVITYGENNAVTYGTPVALPGAVNLSLDTEGERNVFYADNIEYFVTEGDNGYSGDLELALIPDSFYVDILGQTQSDNGILTEVAGAAHKEFALLFQFEGDTSARRFALYRCTAGRPQIASQTKEDSITPVTETIPVTAMPRLSDHIVRGKVESTASAYNAWFTAVQEPTQPLG